MGEAAAKVRGSSFLAVAAPVASEEEARALVAERERARFDASHHCSAWRLRDGTWRANDAGEPSGSAGAPILAAIDGAELRDVIVVVTRYFGGTKLGVGGLIRAYGDAAAAALAAATLERAVPAVRLRIRYGYDHTSAVMRALERFAAAEVEHGFVDGGDAGELSFTIPARLEHELREMLTELSSGSIEPSRTGPALLRSPAGGPPPLA